jgi:lactoylglutathione lyase
MRVMPSPNDEVSPDIPDFASLTRAMAYCDFAGVSFRLRWRGNTGGRPAMATYTWDHIHLRTPDPEATAQWYERMLGAEVIRSMQQGKPRIDLKLGGANIFIAPVEPGDGVNPPPLTPYQGLDHFGLTVDGIDALVAELKAKGVEFTRGPTTVRPGVRVAFLRAPEGVSIELLERKPV